MVLVASCLFSFILIVPLTWGSPDKKFDEIVADLDEVERSVSIKRIETYHTRTKPDPQSLMLLAQLYSIEKSWERSLGAFLKIPDENRNVDYWVSVLYVLSQQPTLLEKSENQEALKGLVPALKQNFPAYDRRTEDQVTVVLDQLKDTELKKIFCDDLLKKNSRKCRVK